MRTATDTIASTREQARKHAEEVFARHTIVPEGPGRWYCGRPGTGCYSFRVVTSPGAVIVHGDIGEAVFCPNERDPLPWLRGVAEHREIVYLLCKMRVGPEQEFYLGNAEEHLQERLANKEAAADEVAEALSWDGDLSPDLSSETWYAAWLDAGDDEPRACVDHSFGALWLAEALCWFGKNLRSDDEVVAEHLAGWRP